MMIFYSFFSMGSCCIRKVCVIKVPSELLKNLRGGGYGPRKMLKNWIFSIFGGPITSPFKLFLSPGGHFWFLNEVYIILDVRSERYTYQGTSVQNFKHLCALKEDTFLSPQCLQGVLEDILDSWMKFRWLWITCLNKIELHWGQNPLICLLLLFLYHSCFYR